MTTKIGLPLALLALCAGVRGGHGQDLRTRHIPQTQAEMHSRAVELYSFHPAQVSDAERAEKSKQMDVFWNEMKVKPELTLPLLRAELQNTGDPTFFFTDGTELLLTLSKAQPDKELAATVLPRVDLADTQPTAYFHTVHDLACDGVNVTAAAMHILDDPRFGVSVPQHAMVLDQREALMYVLLSMREETWMKPAEERFAAEKDEKAKLALLFAIFYAETDEGGQFIGKVANDPAQPEAIRKQAQSFAKDDRDVGKTILPVHGSIEELRKKRRERLHAVSDEAMYDVQGMSKKIAQLRAKGQK